MQLVIEKAIADEYSPEVLTVENESHKHNVPENAETHFKVVCVCKSFEGMPRVKRHQAIYALCARPLDTGVHALALHLYTPNEWAEKNTAPTSPPCLGGSA